MHIARVFLQDERISGDMDELKLVLTCALPLHEGSALTCWHVAQAAAPGLSSLPESVRVRT